MDAYPSSSRDDESALFRKYDLDLDMFDSRYIESCSDVRQLVRIMRVLRSGELGSFPHLEHATSDRIALLQPDHRIVRKKDNLVTKAQLSADEWNAIERQLDQWKNERPEPVTDAPLRNDKIYAAADADFCIPSTSSIRRNPAVLSPTNTENHAANFPTSSADVAPRIKSYDYHAWEKYNVDSELERLDEQKPAEENSCKIFTATSSATTIPDAVAGVHLLTDFEREEIALREKHKGSEAYRAGDYVEAVAYFTRSISAAPTANASNNCDVLKAAINNRAQAYLKLNQCEQCVADCDMVLTLEHDNIKAHLRAATALKQAKQYAKAREYALRGIRFHPDSESLRTILSSIDQLLAQDKVSAKLDDTVDSMKRVIVSSRQANSTTYCGKAVSTGPIITEITDDDETEHAEALNVSGSAT